MTVGLIVSRINRGASPMRDIESDYGSKRDSLAVMQIRKAGPALRDRPS